MKVEDQQPNELRIIPKGAGVPLVRTTQVRHPLATAASARGRLGRPFSRDGRGSHPFSGQIKPGAPSRPPQRFDEERPTHRGPGQTTIDGHHRTKRRKIDGEMDVQYTPQRPSPHTPSTFKQPKSSRKLPGTLHTTQIELPRECKRNVPNSQKLRSEFIRRELDALKRDKVATIKLHAVLGDSLHVTYQTYGDPDTVEQIPWSRNHAPTWSKRNYSQPIAGPSHNRENSGQKVATVEWMPKDIAQTPISALRGIIKDSHLISDHAALNIQRQNKHRNNSARPRVSAISVEDAESLGKDWSPESPRLTTRFDGVTSFSKGHPSAQRPLVGPRTPVKERIRPAPSTRESEGHLEPSPASSLSLEKCSSGFAVSAVGHLDNALPVHRTMDVVQVSVKAHGYTNSFVPRRFRSGALTLKSPKPSIHITKEVQHPPTTSALSSAPTPATSTSGDFQNNSLACHHSDESSSVQYRTTHQPHPRSNDSIIDLTAGSDSDTLTLTSEQSANGNARIQSKGEIVRLPKENHDKLRRVLLARTQGNTLSVSMHGFIHEITQKLPRRQRAIRIPPEATRDSVDDACLLKPPFDNIAISGQSRDSNQLLLVHLANDTTAKVAPLTRPASILDKKVRGVSCVSAMHQPLMFATGGHDHTIHLWTVGNDLHSATPLTLQIRHSALVQSLIPIQDTSSKLLSAGADCCVNIWDISSERTVSTIKTSNSVFNLHAMTQPHCVCLEVAHRDLQFEMRDYRVVPRSIVQRFGYTSTQFHGRFIKGDVNGSTFACGDRSGAVRLWDFRNVVEPVQTISCFPEQKIIQVAFDRSDLIVCSEDHRLMFLDRTFEPL